MLTRIQKFKFKPKHINDEREEVEKFYGNVSSQEAMKVLKENETKSNEQRKKGITFIFIYLSHYFNHQLRYISMYLLRVRCFPLALFLLSVLD